MTATSEPTATAADAATDADAEDWIVLRKSPHPGERRRELVADWKLDPSGVLRVKYPDGRGGALSPHEWCEVHPAPDVPAETERGEQ